MHRGALIVFCEKHLLITRFSQSFFACLLATFVCASVAQAQTSVWIGGTGSWFSAGNWSAGVPNPVSIAQISNGGTAQIAGDIAHANGVGVGSINGTSGTLAVFSIGGVRADLQVGGDLGLLLVGGSGTGTLRISGEASVTDKSGGIGGFSGSSGSATVSGPGARWNNLNSLTVGGSGTSGRGTLLIEAGGTVSSPDSHIGGLAGASAMVTGAGSNWLTNGNLEIGNYNGTGGFGTLTAADSGLVRVVGQLTISALSSVVLGAGGAPVRSR